MLTSTWNKDIDFIINLYICYAVGQRLGNIISSIRIKTRDYKLEAAASGRDMGITGEIKKVTWRIHHSERGYAKTGSECSNTGME